MDLLKGILLVLVSIAVLGLLAGGIALAMTVGVAAGAAALGIGVLVFLYHWIRHMLSSTTN